MNRLVLVAASIMALSACSSEKSGTITNEDGDTVEYAIDGAGEDVTATISSDDGDATVRSGKNVDVKLPAGFTIYPGAEVQHGTSFTADNGEGGLINMTSSASPQKMVDFYRKQAEAAGARITLSATAGERMMLAGEKDGGVKFTFNAGKSGDKTEAQLVIGEGL